MPLWRTALLPLAALFLVVVAFNFARVHLHSRDILASHDIRHSLHLSKAATPGLLGHAAPPSFATQQQQQPSHTSPEGHTGSDGHQAAGVSVGPAAHTAHTGTGPEAGSAKSSRFDLLRRRSSEHATQGPGYLAMCTIARDVQHDIREWAEFHLWSGVEKIFLFDHNSSRPLLYNIEDLVTGGLIQYEYLSSPIPVFQGFARSPQGNAYKSCLLQARDHFRWMAFIDADEFIVIQTPLPPGSKYSEKRPTDFSIPHLLHRYELFPALALGWVVFGPSRLQKRPTDASGKPAPVLSTFTRCSIPPKFTHVKVVVQVKHVRHLGDNPHNFVYMKQLAVSEQLKPVPGPFLVGATAKHIAIHHYMTKSRSEYEHRVAHYRQGMSGWVNKSIALLGWAEQMEKHECLQGAALGKLVQADLASAA